MLPLLGPSTGRDAVGRVVDLAFDPLTVLGAAERRHCADRGWVGPHGRRER